ncbi:MAG: hypothetical protein EPO23_14365 [Xanthobacteraceae bacterium]|nr:MAG: hypothetical protein EPO23_14365 [Xanthobacteraceae bacterium]
MTVTPSSTSLASATQTAGTLIRYAFYLFGAGLFAVLGYAVLSVWNLLPQTLSQPASFSINAPALSRLSATTRVVKVLGARAEMRQWGQLYDRDVDMTAVMVLPSGQSQVMNRDFMYEMRDLRFFSSSVALATRGFYDLETRFGPVRATEFTVNSDGRTKLCLAWLTRFETAAVYFKGWYCEASGARPNFHGLACILDRLSLERDLPDDEASLFLRERMKRSSRCSAEPVSQTVDTRSRSPASGRPYSTKLPVVRR